MRILPNPSQWFIIAVLIVTLWDLVWRGMALWKSAQRKQLVWFVFLLVINSAGILPIIYLLLNRGPAKRDAQMPQ
jgi:hypothetical protein